jgi:hypothetical protein
MIYYDEIRIFEKVDSQSWQLIKIYNTLRR